MCFLSRCRNLLKLYWEGGGGELPGHCSDDQLWQLCEVMRCIERLLCGVADVLRRLFVLDYLPEESCLCWCSLSALGRLTVYLDSSNYTRMVGTLGGRVELAAGFLASEWVDTAAVCLHEERFSSRKPSHCYLLVEPYWTRYDTDTDTCMCDLIGTC